MMSARRVGIVTINDDTNFGNRLQNYALQEAVRSFGWEPETIRNRPPAWDASLLAPRMAHELQTNFPDLARRGTRKLGVRFGARTPPPRFAARRRAAIKGFADAHLTESEQLFSEASTDYWSARYARAIAGSDQVWNPTYRRAQGLDFLEFVEPAHRLSYAASFGVEAIPKFLRSRYEAWLRQIPQLSVREAAAAAIVADLIGRQVPVVVDPTMLVRRETWDRLIANEPPVADRPYAVRFFLGRPSPAQAAWAARQADDAGLDVVDLNDLDREEHSEVGPAGFIAAIARADLVLTDSFHAGVFALLYRRPLAMRARFAKDARLDTLFSLHGLTAQPTGVDGIVQVADVDWGAAESLRQAHRASSESFLRHALGTSS